MKKAGNLNYTWWSNKRQFTPSRERMDLEEASGKALIKLTFEFSNRFIFVAA